MNYKKLTNAYSLDHNRGKRLLKRIFFNKEEDSLSYVDSAVKSTHEKVNDVLAC